MDKIWGAVKEVKSNASLENYPEYCFYDNLYDAGSFKMEQVAAVEKILKIESSELRFNNVSIQDFKTAAEMFLYLNMCPKYDWYDWFHSWHLFYKDLFTNQSPDQILLTLNRIIVSIIVHDKEMEGKDRAEKLFKKFTMLTDLTFEEIQSMLPGGPKNISVIGIRGGNSFNKDGNNIVKLREREGQRVDSESRLSIVDCRLLIIDIDFPDALH